MQSTICILFIALAASMSRAKVKIVQGNDISIEFDKPLKITFSNDKTSDVVFRHQQSVVALCLGKYGCNIDDERFNILQNTSAERNEYVLTSKDNIQPDLCGVYECKDLLSTERDSAQVSIIGFDTEKYNATEEKDAIYLTTACTFHVSLSDMQIVWYTYDNTTLKLLDETRMGNSMGPFNSKSVCSDKCGTLSAYRFTFGLNITHEEQDSTNVFIETKIFHPDYMNKPLIWRSSETFRVKDSSPKTPTHPVLFSLKVSALLLVPILIGFVIYALIRFRRKRSNNTPTLENTNPWIMRCMRRLLLRCGKAATPRHTETQPVGESGRDLQYISGENKHHLRAWFIHSQSDEDISVHEGKIVSIHDIEIESDRDLQCISGEKTHHLRDSWIHSQSDEDISVYEGQMVSIHNTEIKSDKDLQCIVEVNTPLDLPDSCILSQSDEDIPLCVKVLRDDTEIDSDIDLVYITNKDYLQDSGIHSQSDEDIPLSLCSRWRNRFEG